MTRNKQKTQYLHFTKNRSIKSSFFILYAIVKEKKKTKLYVEHSDRKPKIQCHLSGCVFITVLCST